MKPYRITFTKELAVLANSPEEAVQMAKEISGPYIDPRQGHFLCMGEITRIGTSFYNLPRGCDEENICLGVDSEGKDCTIADAISAAEVARAEEKAEYERLKEKYG